MSLRNTLTNKRMSATYGCFIGEIVVLIAVGIGLFVGWLPIRLAVSRWPKWWVAVISVCATAILLFSVALVVAGMEWAGGVTVERFGRVFGGIFLSGTVTAVLTARNCLRRAKADGGNFNDSYGYRKGGLG